MMHSVKAALIHQAQNYTLGALSAIGTKRICKLTGLTAVYSANGMLDYIYLGTTSVGLRQRASVRWHFHRYVKMYFRSLGMWQVFIARFLGMPVNGGSLQLCKLVIRPVYIASLTNVRFRAGRYHPSGSKPTPVLRLASSEPAMMGMRIYALYGRSKRMLVFLSICFAGVQSANIVLTMMAMLPLEVGASMVSSRRIFLHFNERHRDLDATMSTFLGLIVRDNILYFFINSLTSRRAFFSLSLNAASFLIDVRAPNLGAQFYMGFDSIVVNVLTSFQMAMLGPRMMLSMREYDAVQAKGGPSLGIEVETMQFAAAAPRPEYHEGFSTGSIVV
ncbi:hypothetical protein CONPUDRAFT_78328 [Coniophora puteana RWD-64-598 SS2]|uniref:Uncharacterized protein n=1 Tax=Coniophora puteana (strain RWD-64-598) TaxID=741705 RepID=R7SD09_CONPW|nr:uncharacterized protein CONPUDRAFT_78328 [Coniophora puteana RWD-64-598 SS2]EIW74061.1 hypothetical protein CONPUDRAFT_78328 [Coniophora puteana RWD-64-598 SS2]